MKKIAKIVVGLVSLISIASAAQTVNRRTASDQFSVCKLDPDNGNDKSLDITQPSPLSFFYSICPTGIAVKMKSDSHKQAVLQLTSIDEDAGICTYENNLYKLICSK